jgi:hypothetical protein
VLEKISVDRLAKIVERLEACREGNESEDDVCGGIFSFRGIGTKECKMSRCVFIFKKRTFSYNLKFPCYK